MGREKNALNVTVPSYFRCPISMDVMKSPVSLCTGVTYDRSSIQAWLDTGHNTCPATMQVLPSTDFVPNLTLGRLIRHWSDEHSLSLRSPQSGASTPRNRPRPISKQQVMESIKSIGKSSGSGLDSLSQITDFALCSEENREFLASIDGFVPTIAGALSNVDEVEVLEWIITILDLISSENRVKEELQRLVLKGQRDGLSPFLSVLQRGSLSSRVKSARVLETISSDSESQRAISEKEGLLYELYRLASSESDMTAVEAGLSCLVAVSTSRPVNKELVRFGIVRTAGKLLSDSELTAEVIEKALELLLAVSMCSEGRTAIGEDERCVAAIVSRLMKVSRAATEHGVTVLWSVCYVSRDRTAQEAATKSNGLTKLLLVMQSDCTARARKMSSDLVKVLRVNSKSCLASYETRTTHIMPY
ncbi:Ubiquitin--protein ligase [Bertholletia excelsa]